MMTLMSGRRRKKGGERMGHCTLGTKKEKKDFLGREEKVPLPPLCHSVSKKIKESSFWALFPSSLPKLGHKNKKSQHFLSCSFILIYGLSAILKSCKINDGHFEFSVPLFCEFGVLSLGLLTDPYAAGLAGWILYLMSVVQWVCGGSHHCCHCYDILPSFPAPRLSCSIPPPHPKRGAFVGLQWSMNF